MTCCNHCKDSHELFDRTKAEKQLRTYRQSGLPNKSTGLLIDGLKSLNLDGKTLLDVGGGVGMIQYELLSEGLSGATMVEASPAYLEVAQNEARQRGYADRISHRYGDFVELAPEISAADLVTLDRVICCYPHLQELVQASTAKAKRWYGVVYPKERWYNQLGERLANTYFWIRNMDFRLYVHADVDATIRAEGFAPFYEAGTILWRVALYERQDDVEHS